MAQADGFTPTNPFNAGIASYYASNSVSGYYAAFPQFSGVSDTTSFVGNENWNALEISIKQRQSHGLNWMLNYTFSKVIDDLGTFRVYDNPRLDRSVSTANQPHNLVGTAVYHLPLGKGHMFGDSLAYRAAVSDWSVSGIATYHSGLPIILTGSGCGGAGILGTCEPSLVPGQKGRQHSYGKTASGAKVSWDPSSPNYIGTVSYINPAAFTVMNAGTTANYGTYGLLPGSTTTYATSSSATNQAYFVGNGPALYAPGNAPRVAPLNMYGQSTTNFDMALKRTFPIYRNWKFAFEMDMTNVANHVVYSAPASANNVVQTGTNNTSFGTITNVQNKPRDIQFSGRISW